MTIKRLTVTQAICLTVMTGTLMVNPLRFRQEIGKKFGRNILPNEFADPEFQQTLQAMYADEFRAMCNLEEDSGLILPT